MTNHDRTVKWLALLGLLASLGCEGKKTSIPAAASGGNGGGTLPATSGPDGSGGSIGNTSGTGTGGTTLPVTTAMTATGGVAGAASASGRGGETGIFVSSPPATGGAGGAGTNPEVLGGPCSVPGEQSACAHAENPCAACWGHWLYCWNGKWQETHCDPIVEPPLAEPPPDAAMVVDVASEARPIDVGYLSLPSDGPEVLRGYLVFGTELTAFEPCNQTLIVWANLTGSEKGQDLLPEIGPICRPTDAGPAICPVTVYIEFRGAVSPMGSYGHMGKFSQEIRIGEYLTASKTGPADCPFLTPVYPS